VVTRGLLSKLDGIIEWSPVAGRVYSIYESENLLLPFKLLQGNMSDSQNNLNILPLPASGRNFFRLVVEIAD